MKIFFEDPTTKRVTIPIRGTSVVNGKLIIMTTLEGEEVVVVVTSNLEDVTYTRFLKIQEAKEINITLLEEATEQCFFVSRGSDGPEQPCMIAIAS